MKPNLTLPSDMPTCLGVTLMMVAVALRARWQPARKTAVVDPKVAPRVE